MLIPACVYITHTSQKSTVFYKFAKSVKHHNSKKKITDQNKGKLRDSRKCFLVKQWATKSEMKDGERMSYLAWNHLKLSYSDILEEYIKQIGQMSEHAFFASWNYGQYKNSKSNIQHGEVVMVQDFAQNYLCNLQNEPQAIHWLHKQATLHPTVVHYKCPVDDCHTVTHEVVHISNDLKHDAHLVE